MGCAKCGLFSRYLFNLEISLMWKFLSKMNAAAGSFVLQVSRLIKNFFLSSFTSVGGAFRKWWWLFLNQTLALIKMKISNGAKKVSSVTRWKYFRKSNKCRLFNFPSASLAMFSTPLRNTLSCSMMFLSNCIPVRCCFWFVYKWFCLPVILFTSVAHAVGSCQSRSFPCSLLNLGSLRHLCISVRVGYDWLSSKFWLYHDVLKTSSVMHIWHFDRRRPLGMLHGIFFSFVL